MRLCRLIKEAIELERTEWGSQMDELDKEALDYLHEKNATFAQQIPSDRLKAIASGGKRGTAKTTIPDKKRQAHTGTYISDEPERFIKYIDKLKGQFITEEQAVDKIKKEFEHDTSLKHLIDGLIEKFGDNHMRKEVASIVNTEEIKKWFNYAQVAKRLKIPLNEFQKRVLPHASKEKLFYFNHQIATKQKVRLRYEDLFVKRKDGTVKGERVNAVRTSHKLYSKKVVVYRDAKGRFAKV
jgi:hypothetical protein